MDIAESFAATIGDRNSGLALDVVVIPRRALRDDRVTRNSAALREALGVRALHEIKSASALPAALALTLGQTSDPEPAVVRAALASIDYNLNELVGAGDYDVRNFVEYAAYAKVIPFEESPLDLQSLAGIFAGTSAIGVGGAIGYLVVAGAASPLLLLSVPAGVVICAAAYGVAQGLQPALKYNVMKLMGMPEQLISAEMDNTPTQPRRRRGVASSQQLG